MGWAKDMLFLGGYLSPAVLAEEIELERAVEAAAAARRGAAEAAGSPARAMPAARPVRTRPAPARTGA